MSITRNNGLSIRPPGSKRLDDNVLWMNRFEIHSQTSGRIYIIAQNKASGKFGCSCPAYRTRRHCKHLVTGCGLSLSQIHENGLIGQKKRGDLNE